MDVFNYEVHKKPKDYHIFKFLCIKNQVTTNSMNSHLYILYFLKNFHFTASIKLKINASYNTIKLQNSYFQRIFTNVKFKSKKLRYFTSFIEPEQQSSLNDLCITIERDDENQLCRESLKKIPPKY